MRRPTTVSTEQLEHPLASAIVQGKPRSEQEPSERTFVQAKSGALQGRTNVGHFNL
jgi:hypothetical protein